MIKCEFCHCCLESRLIDNKKYYYCYLCNRYYRLDKNVVIDVTLELKEKGLV